MTKTKIIRALAGFLLSKDDAKYKELVSLLRKMECETGLDVTKLELAAHKEYLRLTRTYA